MKRPGLRSCNRMLSQPLQSSDGALSSSIWNDVFKSICFLTFLSGLQIGTYRAPRQHQPQQRILASPVKHQKAQHLSLNFTMSSERLQVKKEHLKLQWDTRLVRKMCLLIFRLLWGPQAFLSSTAFLISMYKIPIICLIHKPLVSWVPMLLETHHLYIRLET